MSRVRVWKPWLPSGEERPSSGPASHDGQPPTREGTYCVGALAAPAHSSSTLARIPSSPIAPSTLAPRRGAHRSRRAATVARRGRRRPPDVSGWPPARCPFCPLPWRRSGPTLTLRFPLSSQAPDWRGCCAPREVGAPSCRQYAGVRTVHGTPHRQALTELAPDPAARTRADPVRRRRRGPRRRRARAGRADRRLAPPRRGDRDRRPRRDGPVRAARSSRTATACSCASSPGPTRSCTGCSSTSRPSAPARALAAVPLRLAPADAHDRRTRTGRGRLHLSRRDGRARPPAPNRGREVSDGGHDHRPHGPVLLGPARDRHAPRHVRRVGAVGRADRRS